MRRTTPILAVALALACAAPARADAPAAGHDMATMTPKPAAAPLFNDRGTYHFAISTKVPAAQRYFDQGMRLMYGFNLEEAERSFEQAEQLDPKCAMCAWGTAFSLGPHINLPALPDRTVKANAAAQRAVALMSTATPLEKELIQAMSRRYSDPAPTTPDVQARLDQGYSAAMHEVMQHHPGNVDVAVLWVESAMDVHPWDLYTPDGQAKPWTPEIVSTLEAVLQKAPNHVGANHFYIHAVEASTHPERALAAAKRLGPMAPGDGHLVHMPSHIYERCGMYDQSAEWNRKAIQADDKYRTAVNPQGFYLMYVAHNHQFLMAACQMQGRAEEALAQARAVEEVVPLDMLRQMPGFDLVIEYPAWTMVRFGKWNDVLNEPAPPQDFAYAKAVWHAARSVANSALGKLDAAQAERDSLTSIAAAVPAEQTEGLNPAKTLLSIATNLANGELEAKRGNTDAAVTALQEAVKLEDGLRYDEPSDWYFPVRHVLGDVLLQAGRPADAQAVYEADLQHNRDNGWALTGLAKSLTAQNKAKDASDANARAAKAWKDADTKVTASAF